MCSRLGSELPIPLSVISEQSLIHLLDNSDGSISRSARRKSQKHVTGGDLECNSLDAFSLKKRNASGFDKELDSNELSLYEKQLINLIDKLLDVDCTSNLLYVDHKSDVQTRKHWKHLIEQKFCLLNPIRHMSCYDETSKSDDIKAQHQNGFNEAFLSSLKKSTTTGKQTSSVKHDVIIIKNCIQNFTQPDELIKTLFDNHLVNSVDKGTVLIVQRSYQYNCLPFFDSLDKVWGSNDFNLNQFIDKLKVHKFDVIMNIEEIDCNMSKMNWLLSLNNNQIYPLDYFNNKKLLVDDENIDAGVRQICEGIFKYGSDSVTFYYNQNGNSESSSSTYGDEKHNYIFKDRLVFLTIKRSNNYFKLQKFKNKFLNEEKHRFRNVQEIQETINTYFDSKNEKKINSVKDAKKANLKASTANIENDVMDILFEIQPSLEGKIFGQM